VKRSALLGLRCLLAASLLVACGSAQLDAGSDQPRGPLPIDSRNPVILANDGARDNWDGEYALTFAARGEIDLLGIIVTATLYYPDIDSNVQGWRDMVKAARDSGLQHLPDPSASIGPPLVRPANDEIDATEPNHSEGARFIIDEANARSQPLRPIVIAVGGRLTEIADAYLLDPSVAARVVVVASLGGAAADGSSAAMTVPNGDLDPWADEIVLRKFRYVQVDAFYAQEDDITADRAPELPSNSFGAWIEGKLGDILATPSAADQNSVIACALPDFALDLTRMSEASVAPPPAGASPTLAPDPTGNGWVVTRGDNAEASARFWQELTDPATFTTDH
jgi:hypothetical protein